MDKLIELLNEYDNNNWGVTDYGALFNRMDEGISGTEDLQVISEKFGFIKWLIENDKINLEHLEYLESCCMCGGFVRYGKVDGLIMKLSISSSPIEDLIFYLK